MDSMRGWIWLCVAVTVPSATNSHAAAPPQRQEPLKGAIVSGHILTCELKERIGSETRVWLQPRRGGRPVNVQFHGLGALSPLRWHVTPHDIWVSEIGQPGFGSGALTDCVSQRELSDLFAEVRVKTADIFPPVEFEQRFSYAFRCPLCLLDARYMSIWSDFTPFVQYDFLPRGRDCIHVFLITNVGGRGSSEGETDQLAARAYPRRAELKWSFTCHSIRVKNWNAKRGRWTSSKEQEEFTLDLTFREPFQALARGEDYYFLTASGKLYRAAKPKKGTHRKLETIWDDKRSPIVAHITDADRNRTFLFCEGGPKGKGGPCVFELASGVRPRFYEKDLFKPGNQGPDKLRRVLGFSRVLESLGYIKATPPTVAPQKGK